MPRARNLVITAAVVAAAVLRGRAAQACGWDDETYVAEAESLPCVYVAATGRPLEHGKAYYEARIAAADRALAWAPSWLGALDMKGVALMKQRRLDEAREVFLRRAAIDPDGYPTHANLGTLYTFAGDLDRALEHVDRSMAIEPKAHFGREKYHRALVVHLKEKAADPASAKKHDFLGLSLTEEQRFEGSEQRFAAAGQTDEVFDALVSMIAVYGAKDVPDIYLALGDVLALRGHRRLAWVAYGQALALKHPQRDEIVAWRERLFALFERERSRRLHIEGTLFEMDRRYRVDATDADWGVFLESNQRIYAAWETMMVKSSLPVWSAAGLEQIYRKQNELSPRCRVPGVIRDEGEMLPDTGVLAPKAKEPP